MSKGGARQRVIILGAGFGGLAAAKHLRGVPDVEVTVIDRHPTHTYHPLLYEVATGLTLGPDLVGAAALSRGVSFAYEQLLAHWGCGFVHGTVTKVDTRQRTVVMDDGETYPYEALVVAFGFATDFFGIQGLAEHCYILNSLEDALKIRERLMDFIERKKRGRDVSLRVMIGGGGATGVETAAELAHFFHSRQRHHEIHSGDWNIRLVEASPRLLGMLPEKLSAHALNRLDTLGVKVMLDTCIKRVEDHHVVLAPRPLKEGEQSDSLLCEFRAEAERRFESDVLIWCGGVRAAEAANTLGLPLDRKGRLAVDATLAVSGVEGVFAVGDCAALADPASGKPVPNLAQSAIEMGHVAASNVVRRLRGQALFAFPFHAYPAAIPLGGKNAVVAIGRLHVRGFLGYVVRQIAALRYYLSVLPFTRALDASIRGSMTYSRND